MDFGFFNQLLIIFSVSVFAIALFHRLRIPDTLAYLMVGIALGPTATGIIDTSFDITLLAEIGVVFLLFSLGLEFSLANVLAMRRIVFGLGGLQVMICTLLIGFCGLMLGFSPVGTLVMAAGLSLSSTAIVSKELTRRNELRSNHGQLAIGTLIFQDIAAVFFLILIPAMAGIGENSLAVSLLLSLGKGLGFVAFMVLFGRWVLPRMFHEIASTKSEELFVLSAIVVCLVAAWLTHLLDLSMALGGFVAGMMLGESHYRHQIETDIRPFRDILLGLFFVSVGLMLNLDLFLENWSMILLASLGLILFKATMIAMLAWFIQNNKKHAIRTGICLAQSGEFCFALVALAGQYGLLEMSTSSMILSITIVSMAATPLLIRYSGPLASRITQQKQSKEPKKAVDVISEQTCDVDRHILILGYGRVGQVISRFLREDNLPYVAIDDDPIHVREASRAGEPVFFGDCRRTELLQAAGLERARMVVICIDSSRAAQAALEGIRSINKTIPILVRTRDDNKMELLKQGGATEVVPEVLESSLVIVSHVLTMLGQPEFSIRQRIQSVRRERYDILHGFFFGQSETLRTQEGEDCELLQGITLADKAWAVGKTVAELPLDEAGIHLKRITRDGEELDIDEQLRLTVGDALLIKGTQKQIEQGEILLLRG
ncbi:monovalent cation:proton antiporter family protein [Parendozoicomonas haliclonae]|uniref:Glutathione-regulated potassium-efflux system protein KefC n=1 Tax=Parendozoicomonas haliclonae TaxID=1960125 RepID=A0A1X7APD7_9GAMM|nr:monovalent cation:proton antiporter family protein [Parendozoicomonas haliclonae]SMA49114.1 Glutathione-regulated potassium-efflux system protein KefC [Parendozoicomonas haliclonae]